MAKRLATLSTRAQPRPCIGHVNRMIPRSCSLVEGPVPPTSLPRSVPEKRLVSAHLRSWWAGPQCGSDIWLIPLPSPNLRCRPSDVRQSVLLRFFARFGSIATGIRFRHGPSDLQSPDARGLVINVAPVHASRLTARLPPAQAKFPRW